ncbi:DUF1640-domain-containing protein [Acaromyces ingoldii]|uniref:DUF1640-domain-containing protein n=1 Tax=Acaromyces ingoldii TaxID=215250 RepID=A0A316YFV2_9BASI|nr:DUF1640-domain-containing protein [Acaromyces ingoldii]PWN88430.1 DUF1640-domain-containing protein [Acaromyces ingoldii]
MMLFRTVLPARSTSSLVASSSSSWTPWQSQQVGRAGRLAIAAQAHARARAQPISTSAPRPAFHFDTHGFVTRLEASGMPRQQADALVTALGDVVEESISGLEKGLVSREEGERWRYSQKVDFARLKSDIQLLERNDFALMKSENERLMADVEKLKQRLREEITRTTAGVRLDLNLEKGRIRDESSVHALKIKEVDTRIESEIAGLRSLIATAKINVLQYLVGVATGAGALLLAYLRMFK